ncbi:MAG: aldo/keto reductase [Planctomycetes bacterium]|nr:aldo/keto reductase [Planctomycetota bacterium]
MSLTRRELLRAAAAGAAAVAGAGVLPTGAASGQAGAMPRRTLARDGTKVGVLGLGGQGLLEDPAHTSRAEVLVRRAVDLGVDLIDTARSYGPSEESLGLALEGIRDRVYLATKTHHRGADEVRRSLETSLGRLRVERLDLVQVHNLRFRSELDRLFAPDGAVAALARAREEGLVRHIGITAHYDPGPLVEALGRFPFDVVSCALNAADRHHVSFADGLIPAAVAIRAGVVAMKVLARGELLKEGIHVGELLRYSLSLPGVSAAVVGFDSVDELEECLAVVRDFHALDAEGRADLERRCRLLAERGANWFQRRA